MARNTKITSSLALALFLATAGAYADGTSGGVSSTGGSHSSEATDRGGRPSSSSAAASTVNVPSGGFGTQATDRGGRPSSASPASSDFSLLEWLAGLMDRT